MVSLSRPVDPDAPPSRTGRGWALLLIGMGGALGTMLRAALESAFSPAPGGWPWATFSINVVGAFLLAVLLEALSLLGPDDGWLRGTRLGVGTGVLGGFTTYSAYMVETVQLGEAGGYLLGLGYAATSLFLGFVAAWSGMVAVAALHRRRVG